MTRAPDDNLLARLAGCGGASPGTDPWAAVAASEPQHDGANPGGNKAKDEKLDSLLERIQSLTGKAKSPEPAAKRGAETCPEDQRLANHFMPTEPKSFRDAGLTDSEVEAFTLKFLLARGDATGREIVDQIKLPFLLIDEMMRSLKNEQLVGIRGSAAMNDFQYQLTDLGRERARRYWAHCTYFGAAPVSLPDYIESVKQQSLTIQQPTAGRLRHAFGDLVLSERMLNRLGPAVNSGRGLFLYGAPGNGKTSIAERVTRAFGQEIWVPRAVGVDGEIIRLFDPAGHEELPLAACDGVYDQRKIDKRWVRIRRPTIVVGGELTLSSLDVVENTSTGICEAPLQMKSNCGTLVIDDFGRQRVRIDELLNRWILPLEKRYDFLNLPNGKKIQIPFDQLIIFSTNLQPADLVDEAFLRRIPYKIEIVDPTEEQFMELFRMVAPNLGFEYRQEPIDYLIERYYKKAGRAMRCCHPRDLLLQIRSFCAYKESPMEITREYFDMAVENYFAVMAPDANKPRE